MGEPDLRGRLTTFTFSDIIQLLTFSGQTGTLTLAQGWNSRTITFEEGRISYIAAATRMLGVGELLLRANKITPAQLETAMKALETERRPVVSTLLHMRAITPDDLKQVREQQLEETIYTLFLWRGCEFAFHANLIQKADGIPVDLNGERLIMEGTRRVDEWIAVSPIVPSVRTVFRQRREAPGDPGSLPADERAVLEQIDGKRDVVDIARHCGLTQFDTAKCLYSLVKQGFARALPPDKVAIVELFNFLVESIYMKLMMYGHSKIAYEFEKQLNKFAVDHALKVRSRGGKVYLSDIDLRIETTALIDLYRLFIAVENNHFSKIFPPEIVTGLVEGLYLHVQRTYQDMMVMYEFYPIDGLLAAARHDAQTKRRLAAAAS